MTQSKLHVAIILDGNGRWAEHRGLPRAVGHREGALAVRRTVEAALDLGIGTLTLFAFSADNWTRPEREVRWLLRMFREYLRSASAQAAEAGVRVSVIGRRDRLPAGVLASVEGIEARTRTGSRLHLRIAVDYSARDAILRAALCLPQGGTVSRERFGRLLAVADHGGTPSPDVDLLIRTSGEQRLSDFLLWECAYAELLFLPLYWPDFTGADLEAALFEYGRRQRRFGGLPAARQGPACPASRPAEVTPHTIGR